MAQGVALADVGKLAYPDEMKTLHARFRDQSLEDYTKTFYIVLSNLFERYVQRELLPLGIAPLAFTCRPYQLPAKQVVKGDGSAEAAKGKLLKTADSHQAAGCYCASQGSWYASARTLAQFGRAMMLSERWLSAGTRSSLYESARWRETYPWAGTVTQAELGTTFGQSRMADHGGAEGGYRAALVLLPDGHVAAAPANSPMDPTEPDEDRNTSLRLAQALVDAFAESTRDPGTGRPPGSGVSPR